MTPAADGMELRMPEQEWNFSRDSRPACPVCLAPQVQVVGSKKGSVIPLPFQVGRCLACGSAFVIDPIHPDHLNEIYSGDYYHGSGLDKKVNYHENIAQRQEFFFEKYDWKIGTEIRRFDITPSCKWLDVGCALGNTMDWARDRFGVATYGIDVSEYAAKIAAQRGHEIIGQNIENDNLDEYAGFFDVVTCYEVLEHVYAPGRFMRRVAALLKPGGLFHYSTSAPPEDSQLLDWAYLRPEVHITFYSPQGMKLLFSQCGLAPRRRFKSFRHTTLGGFQHFDPFRGHSPAKIRLRSLLMKVPSVDWVWSHFQSRLPIGVKK